MNTYEAIIIKNNKIVSSKFCNGIKELRNYFNIPLHYSKNAKCYMMWDKDINYIAKKI